MDAIGYLNGLRNLNGDGASRQLEHLRAHDQGAAADTGGRTNCYADTFSDLDTHRYADTFSDLDTHRYAAYGYP